MPLGATKLYLFGISVDQQFRTEYLTRLTDTAALHDMTYFGLPPYYPAGWFWLGGRAAALTGTPAWEMFKPWAITSITVAIVVAFVLWSKMIRFELALIVTTATAAATLAYSPAEPYAAVITVLLPPVLVLAWSGLRGGPRSGGWAAVVAVGVFLGISALFYTLLVAYSAFTIVIMAALVAASSRRWEPVLRLAVITAIAIAIALARVAALSACRGGRLSRRLGHRAALSARRRRAAVVPDAAVHSSRRAVHGRHHLAGGAGVGACSSRGTVVDAGGRAGDRRAGGLRLVAAVDADHAGTHHAAVVPAAADADRAAGRRGSVRVRRGDAGGGAAIPSRRRHSGSSPPRRCWVRWAPWRSARTSPTCSSPTSSSPTPTPTATVSAPTADRRGPRSTTPRSTRRSVRSPARHATRSSCSPPTTASSRTTPTGAFRG